MFRNKSFRNDKIDIINFFIFYVRYKQQEVFVRKFVEKVVITKEILYYCVCTTWSYIQPFFIAKVRLHFSHGTWLPITSNHFVEALWCIYVNISSVTPASFKHTILITRLKINN